MIDNYDSFTFNLVQALRVLGAEVDVVRNDAEDPQSLAARTPTHVVLSPGPGRPEASGLTLEAIRIFLGRVPVLGVCLGHQALAFAAGARVVGAARLMHGKTSLATHDRTGLFAGCADPMQVGRYHSLAVEGATLPDTWRVTATDERGEVMAMACDAARAGGVQFHPESVLTPDGPTLLANFLRWR